MSPKPSHAPWCNHSWGNSRMNEDGTAEWYRPCNCGGKWNWTAQEVADHLASDRSALPASMMGEKQS